MSSIKITNPRPKLSEKGKQADSRRDDMYELETQVILRLPLEPAEHLREIIREGGPNLKDRLSVKLENDLRYGEVRLDNWLLYAKLLDIPTIVESLKTIDNKSFYKTADVCQMLICKEERDLPTTDDESPTKNKKKDPNKVDKKYLWPHGVTPPCKNIRKRRFRKTLKKKYVEAPEIEKEVKRLLRADNEAVNVKWEIVQDEDEPKSNLMQDESTSQSMALATAETSMDPDEKKHKTPMDSKAATDSSRASSVVRDVDIFGEDVPSSDDGDENINVDIDENTRLSADDSRQSDFSNSIQDASMITEFSKQMFGSSPRSRQDSSNLEPPGTPPSQFMSFDDTERMESDDNEFGLPQLSREEINSKISDLRRQLNDLRNQRIQKEQEISQIQNQTLRQRMQDSLDNILSQILDKEMEMQEYQSMLE